MNVLKDDTEVYYPLFQNTDYALVLLFYLIPLKLKLKYILKFTRWAYTSSNMKSYGSRSDGGWFISHTFLGCMWDEMLALIPHSFSLFLEDLSFHTLFVLLWLSNHDSCSAYLLPFIDKVPFCCLKKQFEIVYETIPSRSHVWI